MNGAIGRWDFDRPNEHAMTPRLRGKPGNSTATHRYHYSSRSFVNTTFGNRSLFR